MDSRSKLTTKATLLLSAASPALSRAVLSAAAPSDAVAISSQLNSFSIEFKDFPLFAGTTSSPNQFSINLLQNLQNRTGVMPKVRVGGTTQDDAIFVQDQSEAVITHGQTNGDDRAGVTIGPTYFDSYGTFPDTTYITGINLAVNGSNGTWTRANETMRLLAALGDNLEYFEIGNEPDLFSLWERRSGDWSVDDYVGEWEDAAQIVQGIASNATFFAPSFAGTDVGKSTDSLSPLGAFARGIDNDGDISEVSGHNYMGSAGDSSVTVQNTLMNHSAVVRSISSHVKLAQSIQQYTSAQYVMGETNSLSGGGATGKSNIFGAALWVVDYALWQGFQGIGRVHFHQSGTSPYSAWAPSTDPPTTNAPYYGNLMVAAAVGASGNTSIAYVDLGDDDDRTSAYAVYEGDELARAVVLNMIQYNSGDGGDRPTSTFSLQVPDGVTGATVERLQADGADVTSGVTFGGVSYDYSPNQGAPNVVDPDTPNETATVSGGQVSIDLPASEGALLHFQYS